VRIFSVIASMMKIEGAESRRCINLVIGGRKEPFHESLATSRGGSRRLGTFNAAYCWH
jgi:hypothetical protein